ncbi:MAG: hypothetical protein IKZ41_02735 [Clostridia bacterium]|nr:hypothetical protein [Clostridia bacterium]MBR5364948.1 hypothetical protein [Clostridia bacterium]
MKKLISLLLALLLTAGAFLSCSEKKEESTEMQNSPSLDAATDAPEEAETEIARANIPDNLPELDFGGADVIIHSRGDDSPTEVVSEEMTGEAVNDAIYERNALIGQRLNVKIDVYVGEGWERYDASVNAIRSSIMASDGAFDIIAGWSARIPALSLEGLFLNLNEMQYLDFGAMWWNQSVVTDLQVGGQLHFLTGDIARSMLSAMYAYAFNQRVAEDNQVEDLYAVVKEHRWTLDYVYNLTSQIYSDLNGNGTPDDEDYYGLVTNCGNDADAYMQAALVSMLSRDEEGYPVLDVDEERLASLVQKVFHLLWENPGGHSTSGGSAWYTNINSFVEDKALFATAVMSGIIGSLADMESDYGLLPYPLYDENQSTYGTRVQDAVSLWSIPIDAKDPDMSAATMEALAAQSWRTVTPAYFDVALKYRYSRDAETAEMVDLIKDSIYINFECLYNESIGNPWFVMRTLMTAKNDNFSSYWASQKKMINRLLGKAVDKMRELGN